MAHFEVEIKTLLGEKSSADALKQKLTETDPGCELVAQNSQLNHYFGPGDIHELYKQVEHLFSGAQHDKFKKITERGSDFSVRTRQKNDEVLLVVKASMDEGDGINAVSRMEFEEPVDLTLAELDSLVLAAGYEYNSKWSRDREEYAYKGLNVCIDRNAGYGYLAEFEKVFDDEDDVTAVRAEIEALLKELGLEELPHDRHDRMFAHYQANWPEYYGTDKTFVVD